MLALRLARAFTGREQVLRLEGHRLGQAQGAGGVHGLGQLPTDDGC